MGLNTTHQCFDGAYNAFSRWRNEVAKAAGYLVAPVTWPDMGYPIDTVMLEWHRYEDKNYQGEWNEVPSDPLILLIVHSDCDGEIKSEHVALLADRLAEILPNMTNEGGGHIGRWGGFAGCTERFIKGLRRAAELGEPVEFH